VPAVCSALQQAASSAAANTGRGSSCCLHEAGKLEQKHEQQQQQRQEGRHTVDTCGLLAALVSTLLEFSFSQHLCGQALEAGVLPALMQILQQEAAAGTASQLSTQVSQVQPVMWQLATEQHVHRTPVLHMPFALFQQNKHFHAPGHVTQQGRHASL